MNFAATLESIRSMNLDERIQLVQAIWDEIAAEQAEKTDLTEEQKQELDRRLAAYEAAPDKVIPWEEVKAQAEARLRR
jgi:putative addiction module component (TIGR02574 family)